MNRTEMVELLRRQDCNGCPWDKECNAADRGCILCEKAADALEQVSAEVRAAFDLGRMDMKTSARLALVSAAAQESKVSTLTTAAMLRAAAIVSELVVT